MKGLRLAPSMGPGSASTPFTPQSHFGALLVLAVDSEHVTTTTGNLTGATDQSGAGNNLTVTAGTIPVTASGGIQNRPFAAFPAAGRLGIATNVVAASADRTVFHVFRAITGTADIVNFRTAAPRLVLRFDSSLHTTSDESVFNNTGTYVFDTTAVHILEVKYHLGSVSAYILDGNTITQAGAAVAVADSGTAGFQINGGAAPGGQIWYATYVISSSLASGDDGLMTGYLRGKYT